MVVEATGSRTNAFIVDITYDVKYREFNKHEWRGQVPNYKTSGSKKTSYSSVGYDQGVTGSDPQEDTMGIKKMLEPSSIVVIFLSVLLVVNILTGVVYKFSSVL
jgi:hypothetical protein